MLCMLCYEKNSGETVRRLGTIIQSIFCAQSGAGICLNFWKQFGESRYPGALLPVLANFRPAFSSLRSCPLPIIPLCLSRPPLKKKKKKRLIAGYAFSDSTDCPWVSEDAGRVSLRGLCVLDISHLTVCKLLCQAWFCSGPASCSK